ncbi:MAG: endonuclease domain-containing protein [Novosphingobium sp.]
MNQHLDKGWTPDSPPLQGRGKGWGLSEKQIAELHKRARDMRNNPTEPEKRLWNVLRGSQLKGFKFRRQEVIGWAIADFVCPKANLIVEVDGETHADPSDDLRRDAYLRGFGFAVLHVTNVEVMRNIEGVRSVILRALENGHNPHPTPSPEGEGLEGIVHEGSVG